MSRAIGSAIRGKKSFEGKKFSHAAAALMLPGSNEDFGVIQKKRLLPENVGFQEVDDNSSFWQAILGSWKSCCLGANIRYHRPVRDEVDPAISVAFPDIRVGLAILKKRASLSIGNDVTRIRGVEASVGVVLVGDISEERTVDLSKVTMPTKQQTNPYRPPSTNIISLLSFLEKNQEQGDLAMTLSTTLKPHLACTGRSKQLGCLIWVEKVVRGGKQCSELLAGLVRVIILEELGRLVEGGEDNIFDVEKNLLLPGLPFDVWKANYPELQALELHKYITVNTYEDIRADWQNFMQESSKASFLVIQRGSSAVGAAKIPQGSINQLIVFDSGSCSYSSIIGNPDVATNSQKPKYIINMPAPMSAWIFREPSLIFCSEELEFHDFLSALFEKDPDRQNKNLSLSCMFLRGRGEYIMELAQQDSQKFIQDIGKRPPTVLDRVQSLLIKGVDS